MPNEFAPFGNSNDQQSENIAETKKWEENKQTPSSAWKDPGMTYQAPEDKKETADWEKLKKHPKP